MGVKFEAATDLKNYLAAERVATLAVPIDAEGTIHLATMNMYNTESPLAFYFITGINSENCKRLRTGEAVKAACAVGTVIGTPFVLQMRGEAQIVDREGLDDVLDAYFQKRGDTNENVQGPNSVVIRFTPDWARYVDYRDGWQATLLELP